MVVGYNRVESSTYSNLTELQDALAKHNLLLADFVKADTTGIKRAAKKDPGLGEDLAAIATDSSYTRFEAKKARD